MVAGRLSVKEMKGMPVTKAVQVLQYNEYVSTLTAVVIPTVKKVSLVHIKRVLGSVQRSDTGV